MDLNGAGNPSWVPRTHPSFPFSYLSGFIDSLKRPIPNGMGRLLFLWLLIADQILRRAVHDLTQLSKGGGRDGPVMSNSLQSIGIYTFICQIIIGDPMLLHIFPHRCKRNWHIITPSIIIWGLILDIIVTIIMLLEVLRWTSIRRGIIHYLIL